MFDSLRRLDQIERAIDRWLPEETDDQTGQPPRLSTNSVLTQYREDPIGFHRDLLGTTLWSRQGDIAVATVNERRVAVRSCNKVGKTRFAAGCALWFATTRPGATVIITAPTERQVKEAVWAEIRAYWSRNEALRSLVPEPKLDPATGCRWADGRRIFGFTGRNADAVSGPSGAEMLVIVDEASGVQRPVWEALQGIRAGGGNALALSNPTQTSGWFFDAFHERREGWSLHHISGLEAPNVTGEAAIPGTMTPGMIAEIAADAGEDSPVYQVRVLGEFPKNVANAVIGLGLVEEARKRWPEADDDGTTLDIGVDVARMGDDDSAVAARRGLKLYTPAWFGKEHELVTVVHGLDAPQLTGVIVKAMKLLRRPDERVRIKIDTTGGFGEPVREMLRTLQASGELDRNVEIVSVVFSASSSDPERYPVLRDELWFGLRDFLRQGGALYPDTRLESELLAPIYALDVKGRAKVELKSETKKRLGRSPDRADAAILAIYECGGIDTSRGELITYESPMSF
jgi:phage terminase large subunit